MGLPGKGGRAKRTPYQCKTKRIPVDLEPQIDELISSFVEGDRSLHIPTYTADQYQILAGKIHELEMELEKSRAITRRLDNLDAAELLQRLRGKLPKSKANLKDVESLLDLMSD